MWDDPEFPLQGHRAACRRLLGAAFRRLRADSQRKFAQLDVAATLDFLQALPGNRLETLRGDRRDSYSIRINDQWRLCFRFAEGEAYDAEIVDYY